MADDLSWIDHPANIRANAALLRIVADQSLLHAAEIERLMANQMPQGEPLRTTQGKTMKPPPLNLTGTVPLEDQFEPGDAKIIARLQAQLEENTKLMDAARDEIERLRAEIKELRTLAGAWMGR